MPGRNQTGPLGQGAMSGRGQGGCGGNAAYDEAPAFGRGRGRGMAGGGGGMGRGRGRGMGRGLGRGFGAQGAVEAPVGRNQTELEQEIEDLKSRLEAVEK